MDKLFAGVEQFRSGPYESNRAFFQQLATKQQKPVALFITCSDSRVHPNLLTQTEPGDLFLIRNAGNIVPPYGSAGGGEAATVEYSVEVLGIRNIVICGHSQCGAMKALLDGQGLEHLPAVKAWCGHAEATRRIVKKKYANLPPDKLPAAATKENVLVQINNLSTHPSVAAHLHAGDLRIFGWYYDIGEGEVLQYDESEAAFVPLTNHSQNGHIAERGFVSASGKLT